MPKEIVTFQQEVIISYDDKDGRAMALGRLMEDTNYIAMFEDTPKFSIVKTNKITIVKVENA